MRLRKIDAPARLAITSFNQGVSAAPCSHWSRYCPGDTCSTERRAAKSMSLRRHAILLAARHPNASAPADSTLTDSSRTAGFDREAYTGWLKALRDVCIERGIVLIFDEVFVGFRLAIGGAQEYFGVGADLVTYGKSLAGGLPTDRSVRDLLSIGSTSRSNIDDLLSEDIDNRIVAIN